MIIFLKRVPGIVRDEVVYQDIIHEGVFDNVTLVTVEAANMHEEVVHMAAGAVCGAAELSIGESSHRGRVDNWKGILVELEDGLPGTELGLGVVGCFLIRHGFTQSYGYQLLD